MNPFAKIVVLGRIADLTKAHKTGDFTDPDAVPGGCSSTVHTATANSACG